MLSRFLTDWVRRAGFSTGAALVGMVAAWFAWHPAVADEFPPVYNSEQQSDAEPLNAIKAASTFQSVPDGMRVELVAAEPEVRNPIAMAWDGRGRLWVAENYTYSERALKFDLNLRDRVLIIADQDGDGRMDAPRVFADDVQRLTGIEVGMDGVFLMCPPRLLFIPDRDHDDRPDGAAEVLLDGFHVPPENYHTVANGLRFGPDGWLYGRCGASSQGSVHSPSVPPSAAVPLNGGIWRYHPTAQVFEPLCHGTTNPWGLDWNPEGEAFFVNTVIGHLWHVIPGAHFRRPHTLTPNPWVYEPMEMIANHWHWDTGKNWTDSRSASGKHDELGGGHAHCGAMIYQGDAWPESYQGKLFTLNLHGRRVNVERLERQHSGFVASHEPDILKSSDPFFRGLDLNYGPDGAVWMIDWSDIGECHEQTGVHRRSGRIFRITSDTASAVNRSCDLRRESDDELIERLKHPNAWYERQARMEWARRASAGTDQNGVIVRLLQQFSSGEVLRLRLRSLWSLQSILVAGGMPSDQQATYHVALRKALHDADESIRVWAIRSLTDRWLLDTVMSVPRVDANGFKAVAGNTDLTSEWIRLAEQDTSGLVRLTLASLLQRLPPVERVALAEALMRRAEDASDPQLPLLVWYGLIPVAKSQPEALIRLACSSQWPTTRRWIARRCSEDIRARPQFVDQFLVAASAASPEARRDILAGFSEGLAGWHRAKPPEHWPEFAALIAESADEPTVAMVRSLAVIFGDGRALDEVRKIVLDEHAPLELRCKALESIIEAEPNDLRKLCEGLLKVRFLNRIALGGLARFDDPAIGLQLARNYRAFHASERSAVMETLVSRPSFAGAMLDEMARGNIPRGDLSAVQARQIRSFGDESLTARLNGAWGELRDSPAERQTQIDALKRTLTVESLKTGDRLNGRHLFAQHCGNCHRLFGAGGEIGPDLTGANRKDLDFVLGNIIDPSAVVNKDFLMTVLLLADGRVINGIVVAENDDRLVLQTAQARVPIVKQDIEQRRPSQQSIMPDGLLQTLSESQVRDLIAYLAGDSQVATDRTSSATADRKRD